MVCMSMFSHRSSMKGDRSKEMNLKQVYNDFCHAISGSMIRCAGVLFYGDSMANGVKASSFVGVSDLSNLSHLPLQVCVTPSEVRQHEKCRASVSSQCGFSSGSCHAVPNRS